MSVARRKDHLGEPYQPLTPDDVAVRALRLLEGERLPFDSQPVGQPAVVARQLIVFATDHPCQPAARGVRDKWRQHLPEVLMLQRSALAAYPGKGFRMVQPYGEALQTAH